MEHHIAQNSPISPRQKGMEGSRQALLYGVYDAFAGALCTLISKRFRALITAIGIAVFTISSSAWASHGDDLTTDPANPVFANDVITDPPVNAGDNQDGQLQPNSVHTEEIGAGEVCGSATTADCPTTAEADINPGSIGTADIAEGGVGPDDLADGAVSGGQDGKIVDNSITHHDIAPNAVTNSELAPDAVQEANIGVGQVCGSENTAPGTPCASGTNKHIQEGSIGELNLADDAVTNAKLDDGAVTNDKLDSNAVSGTGGTGTNNIEANSITDDEIDDDAVGRGELADNAVGRGELADNAVGRDELADNAVGRDEIENDAVNEDKITDNAIRNEHINDNAVDTNEIANLAVETDKIDDEAVTTGKLKQVNPLGATAEEQAGAVSENNINNEAVSERTIRTQAVSERTIRDQAVTSAKLKQINPDGATEEERQGAIFNEHINDDAVSARTIQNDAVQGRHIADGAIEVVGSAGAPRNTNAFQARIVPGSIGLGDFGDDVNNVFRRIEGDIDRLDEGIAMSHAISMIKVPEGKEFGISFAGGFYQDKQAAAIGVGFRPTDGLLLSAGASYGFDSEEVGGAVSINFGF